MITTRFAPSPTGFLHIGGVRTALYSWLYAQNQQGKFILRIEDTDKERSTEEAVDVIVEGMQWLGLKADEGPIFQSDRDERYQQVIQQLLDEGKAYRCYCSKEELDHLRAEQMQSKQKPRYDRKCRELTKAPAGKEDIQPVIRFKTPLDGEIEINDAIKGKTIIQNSELDDLIIARGDGTPTYNFVVVVDDFDMGVTHVIRGDDHYNNTPRQMNILMALGMQPPVYAHLPMILDGQGKKLSKRTGAANLLNYREEGYLPEVLLNYLVRLGWSHGDQEIFSVSEMIKLFDLKDVNKSASALNPEKLLWLNQEYIKNTPAQALLPHLQYLLDKENIVNASSPQLTEVIEALADRSKTLCDMIFHCRYIYQDFDAYDEKALKHLKESCIDIFNTFLQKFADCQWQKEALHEIIEQVAEQHELKMGKVAQPLRVAITGGVMSPSIDVTLILLGREKACTRIRQAIDFIRQHP